MNIREIEIIAPHFKRRLSGVTTTVVQLAPRQVEAGAKLATLGPGLPENMPRIGFLDLLACWKRPASGKKRIWHARRNNEMLAGLILRDILRMPMTLLFTSAAQRRHSRYTKWLISKMDAVVATSVRSGSYLDRPHTVIMHGVDTDVFHPARVGDTDPAPDLGDRLIIGCTGRVRAQKGTDLFVDAMIALLPHYPAWTAVIAGRVTSEHESFAADLRARIEKAGLADRIRFIGEVDDIKPWYRRFQLFVAPSRNEGFGLTPLEAMASGAPAVTSDAGAYAEMIVPGRTGLVVPSGDGDALKHAIEPYLADPDRARRHGEYAARHVRATFAIANEVKGLNGVYQRLFSETAA
jgi:mannosyltransferase